MSARIAPTMQASVATATGHRPRLRRESRPAAPDAPSDDSETTEPERPPTAPPPVAAGSVFTVAVLAAAQPPQPARQLQPSAPRGYLWRPPDSDLKLADRKV